MKILTLCTYDIRGGAARAALRLHSGLLAIKENSYMLVQRKKSINPTVMGSHSLAGRGLGYLRELIDSFPLLMYPNRKKDLYELGWLPSLSIYKKVQKLNPDIIHFHWISSGFVPIHVLAKFKRPMVWTFHDMWAFTGGCHYPEDCTRYTANCGSCPALGSKNPKDLSYRFWIKKKKVYDRLEDRDLTIISPSQWLGQCARKSPLLQNFKIDVIPNGLDLECFKPCKKEEIRDQLNFPKDKQLILFGAISSTSDQRKGFHLLYPALRYLYDKKKLGKDAVELLVFGDSEPENAPDFGFSTRYLGSFSDEKHLARLYGVADVVVAPSVQDNLPNIVMEALACGTPCVAFNIGGMPDMIDHQRNGYLAQPFDTDDLAKGISWVLQQKDSVLIRQARQKVEQEYELTHVAKKYLKLYKELCC